MFTKRMILLAAGSLTVFLSNADLGNRALAQAPAARQQTLSETYRMETCGLKSLHDP
jgi:hypothetical protein